MICDEYGIDPDTVRRVSCAEPFIPLSTDLTPDAEYQEETQKMLSAIVSGRQQRNYSLRATPIPH